MNRAMVTLLMLCLASVAMAQADNDAGAPQPRVGNAAQPMPNTPAPNAPQALTATVLEVTGRAMTRTGAEQPWKPIQKGANLPVGAEVQTGLKSSIVIQTGPNATIVIESLSNIIIGQNEIDEQKIIRTNVGKKYGRMRFDVRDAGFKNDFRVTTPTGVMAVKGTNGGLDGNALTGEHVFGDPSNSKNAIHWTTDFETWLSSNEQVSKFFPTPDDYQRFLAEHPPIPGTFKALEANFDSGRKVSGADIFKRHILSLRVRNTYTALDKFRQDSNGSGGEGGGGGGESVSD